jgi:hypothetical protein
MFDCKAKNRHTHGTKQHKAVLTDEIVLAIRKSKASLKELAAKYKVAVVTVWRVKTGVTWPHAGGEIGRKSGYKGASNGRAVLTERQARIIKKSNELNKVLAVKYGVHSDTISDIKRGKTWRHLDA